MLTCLKCGKEPKEVDKLAWKCTSCGKAYGVKLSYVQDLLEKKVSGSRGSLIKCKECGSPLDDGEEKIFWKCTCGNVQSGKLAAYDKKKNEKKQLINHIEMPKYESDQKTLEETKSLEKTGKNYEKKLQIVILFAVLAVLSDIYIKHRFYGFYGGLPYILLHVFGVFFPILLYCYNKNKNLKGISVLWKIVLVWDIFFILMSWRNVRWTLYVVVNDEDIIGITMLLPVIIEFGASIMCITYSCRIIKDKLFISQTKKKKSNGGNGMVNEAVLLQKYKELLDLDIITPEEFARKRKELL